MKMRVAIEIFFRLHNGGNCVLDQIILCSDECLVLVPANDSVKVSPPFLALVSKLQHQTNKPEAQTPLSFGWPGWLYRGIRAAPPKPELVHAVHLVTPGFDGLGSPCSAVDAWPEQALQVSLVHFPCMENAGKCSLGAASLHLLGEQPCLNPVKSIYSQHLVRDSI